MSSWWLAGFSVSSPLVFFVFVFIRLQGSFFSPFTNGVACFPAFRALLITHLTFLAFFINLQRPVSLPRIYVGVNCARTRCRKNEGFGTTRYLLCSPV